MTRIGGIRLDELKAKAQAEVDDQAAQLRKQFITLDAGMDSVYAQKRREAEAFMADTEISEAETPHLTREAARFETTRFSVAMDIITAATQWAYLSSLIDDRRVWHKHLIDIATNPQEVRQATQVDWAEVIAYL